MFVEVVCKNGCDSTCVHSLFLRCIAVCLFVCSFVFSTIGADSFLLAVECVWATVLANAGGGREECTFFVCVWCGCYKLAVSFVVVPRFLVFVCMLKSPIFLAATAVLFFFHFAIAACSVGWQRMALVQLFCPCVSANVLGYFRKSMFLANHFL